MSSGPSSSTFNDKLIVPDNENGESSSAASKPNGDGIRMMLSVDPDFVDDNNSDEMDTYDGDKPCRIDGNIVEGAKDRSSGVKMSIGNYDEEEMEVEETPEERNRRIAQQMKRFRHSEKQDDFDLSELPKPTNLLQFLHSDATGLYSIGNPVGFDEISPKNKGPKIIEGYLWGAVIGNGSYGKVKEVLDTYTLARRAVKIMKYDKIRKIQNGWANIRSEMKILNTLDHPNIIKMIEVFDIPDKKKIYMIFEYCIGSVQQLIDIEPAKRLTNGESHMIFREMIKGLEYLHSRRISHKDIKPGNLLISIDFKIKICDFGVAEEITIFQDDGKCTKVNGTPKFQPPECVAGNNSYFDGFKVDIWAAGVTLYNMVSGKYPFDEANLLRLYDSIAKDPLILPTNVELTDNLKTLIQKLLIKDFEKRPDTFEVMKDPWYICGYPEDQGMGRILERVKTGNRPLTMRPSMKVLFDGEECEEHYDHLGRVVFDPPLLTEGGGLTREVFQNFEYLQPKPGELEDDDRSSMTARSAPTAAPEPVQAENVKEQRKRRGRGFLSCIFRSRSNS